MMEQSEYGVTERMVNTLNGIPCEVTRHTQFISTADDFESLHKTPDSRITMETFYHKMRIKTGLLMDGKEPFGGSWNVGEQVVPTRRRRFVRIVGDESRRSGVGGQRAEDAREQQERYENLFHVL